jgi:hypothetical protein
MRAETIHAAAAPLAWRLIDLYSRALRLVFNPCAEIQVLANENESIGTVMTRWVAPLVLIMLAAKVLSAWLFGLDIEAMVNGLSSAINMPMTLAEAILFALPLVVQSIVMVFATALLIDTLAPVFGGTRNFVQAVRTAAYIATPAWLVGFFAPAWQMGVFRVQPPPNVALFVGAIWGTWLLLRALPPMMNVSSRKSWGYAAVLVALLAFLWLFALRITFSVITKIHMGDINW